MLPQMRRTLTITLDIDWFYRRLGLRLALDVGAMIGRADHALRGTVLDGLEAAIAAARRYCGPRSVLAQSLSTGTATLWVAVLLGVSLVIYYARG